MKHVILIGDSIRMGYQDGVRAHLAEIAEVWAPAENGGDSRNVLAHLEEWILSRDADLVHVNCGLHDLKREFGAPEPAVPLPEYRRNVEQILRAVLDQTRSKAVWAATTPVNEAWHRENKPFDRVEEDFNAYRRAAAEVCRDLGVPIDDLFEAITAAGRDELLLPDGVHFTEDGYALLARRVAECLRAHL